MKRYCRGQQTVEFAGALVILIVCVFVPLLDIAMIPIRSGLVSTTVSTYAKQLSLAERLSQAKRQVEGDKELVSRLEGIGGVAVKSVTLTLKISSSKESGNQSEVDRAGSIPYDWQPNGGNCPCIYLLNLSVDTEISPLITVAIGGKSIPGLNAPISTTFNAQAPFENLGRDPVTKEFFVNE